MTNEMNLDRCRALRDGRKVLISPCPREPEPRGGGPTLRSEAGERVQAVLAGGNFDTQIDTQTGGLWGLEAVVSGRL